MKLIQIVCTERDLLRFQFNKSRFSIQNILCRVQQTRTVTLHKRARNYSSLLKKLDVKNLVYNCTDRKFGRRKMWSRKMCTSSRDNHSCERMLDTEMLAYWNKMSMYFAVYLLNTFCKIKQSSVWKGTGQLQVMTWTCLHKTGDPC